LQIGISNHRAQNEKFSFRIWEVPKLKSSEYEIEGAHLQSMCKNV